MRNLFITALLTVALVACPAPTDPTVNSIGVVGPESTVMGVDYEPAAPLFASPDATEGTAFNETGFSTLPEEVTPEPVTLPLELDVDAGVPAEESDVEEDSDGSGDVTDEVPLVSQLLIEDEGSCGC
jgi:hypothetical protein